MMRERKRGLPWQKVLVRMALGLMILAAAGCAGRPKAQITILEETIEIEGLSREYQLLFVTDTHVTMQGPGDSEAEAEYHAQRYPMFLGADGADARQHFEAFVEYANRTGVDAVLLGGDIIDSPSDDQAAWLEGQLGRLKMPYLYVPGNHDWTYPWEYMTERGKQEYLAKLSPFMQGSPQIQELDLPDLRIVGIQDSSNQVDGAIFSQFEEWYASQKPMIVLAHVPFLTQSVLTKAREVWSGGVVIGGGNYGGIYPNEDSDRFMKWITQEDTPVAAVLAGHVHFYDRDVIWGDQEVLQLVGPAGYEGEAILLHIRGK